jgi:hypothetical protein
LNNVKEGFIVKGRAPNANDVVGKARVVLAPDSVLELRKLLEAMLCGCISVTTSMELNPCVVIYHGMDLYK